MTINDNKQKITNTRTTKKTFKTQLKIHLLNQIILDCKASWCSPCKKIYPSFVQLCSENHKVAIFAAFDIDNDDDLKEELQIMKLPTFIFYENGKEAQRQLPPITEDKLANLVGQYAFCMDADF